MRIELILLKSNRCLIEEGYTESHQERTEELASCFVAFLQMTQAKLCANNRVFIASWFLSIEKNFGSAPKTSNSHFYWIKIDVVEAF